ncbi:MAG: Glycogen phosphorylase [Pelotomaculum sp. PtaB.Bin104]|nr:MAG: Glycogen phosphorylase [Pelotomaculum sp. PtaB.Bin104]
MSTKPTAQHCHLTGLLHILEYPRVSRGNMPGEQGERKMKTVAYFCAEFGINESLPFYAGGLGILAGDHVKAANDLGLPLVGVSLLYRQGYFQQHISPDGNQVALCPKYNPEDLPLEPVLNDLGEPVLVEVALANRVITVMAWCARVGTVPVYFLDADIKENQPADRRLTDHLYPGEPAVRLKQEILLGIGGVRLLRKLGFEPDAWHLNEGHVAFLILERIREYSAQGIPFHAALEAVRASTVFTTHTPVSAGHDSYCFALLDHYLGDYFWQLGASREEILALGQVGSQFNLTRLAYRVSFKVNGVSKLHADVTRQLFHHWTPDLPWQEIAVESVTNGIHTQTWLAPEMKELYDRTLLPSWEAQISSAATWEPVRAISDGEFWETHQRVKACLLERLSLPGHLAQVLVVGFARRFATYKRATLLLHDLERLDRLVNHPAHPVCLIFAGKAHPSDGLGQEFLRRVIEVSRMDRFRERIFFVENYNMSNSKPLVQGVDLWLNTPIKPMEACGTSGQKAAVNGVINCSVLDGWWDEGYNGANGWAIPSAVGSSQAEQDLMERESLYSLLENEIAPLYYRHGETALPHEWIEKMKESICSLAPVFNTNRMVVEYWEKLYRPAAARGLQFTENNCVLARCVADYKQFIRKNWHQVQFEAVECSGEQVQSSIRLGPVWHKDVLVELVGQNNLGGIWRERLEHSGLNPAGVHIYRGKLPGDLEKTPQADIRIRIVPISPNFVSEFEMELATWSRL